MGRRACQQAGGHLLLTHRGVKGARPGLVSRKGYRRPGAPAPKAPHQPCAARSSATRSRRRSHRLRLSGPTRVIRQPSISPRLSTYTLSSSRLWRNKPLSASIKVRDEAQQRYERQVRLAGRTSPEDVRGACPLLFGGTGHGWRRPRTTAPCASGTTTKDVLAWEKGQAGSPRLATCYGQDDLHGNPRRNPLFCKYVLSRPPRPWPPCRQSNHGRLGYPHPPVASPQPSPDSGRQ
jgi:hypothetical protein